MHAVNVMPIEPLMGNGQVRVSGDRTEQLRSVSWNNSRVVFDHRHWVCADAELRWTAPHHLILLTERGRTARTEVRCDGRLIYDGRDAPGALTFVPAAVERHGAYRDADLFYCALWIDPTFPDTLSGCGRLPALPTFVNQSDPVVGPLMAALSSDISAGHDPGALYIEHMTALALLRIAALRDSAPQRLARAGRLNRKALARVQDYVEANMERDISLSDLAALTGMPIDSFARRFKATTGIAPYAYVLERRVHRAEKLLSATETEISAIALALGFSSQSHFTTSFRRLRGVTPRAYRILFRPDSETLPES
jgi:AraC family transcriptional regulator